MELFSSYKTETLYPLNTAENSVVTNQHHVASLSSLENGGLFGVEKLKWLPSGPGLQDVIFKKSWSGAFGRHWVKAKKISLL